MTSLSLFTFMRWRRQRQPTPVFSPGESRGRGSLGGCCLWGPTGSGTTQQQVVSSLGFPGGSDSRESACNARDLGLTPRWGRCPGDGNGYPLQYSCLENPMDRGAWWATVHNITKSWTRLKRLSAHTWTVNSWQSSVLMH